MKILQNQNDLNFKYEYVNTPERLKQRFSTDGRDPVTGRGIFETGRGRDLMGCGLNFLLL